MREKVGAVNFQVIDTNHSLEVLERCLKSHHCDAKKYTTDRCPSRRKMKRSQRRPCGHADLQEDLERFGAKMMAYLAASEAMSGGHSVTAPHRQGRDAEWRSC